jgi:hypothetical protein
MDALFSSNSEPAAFYAYLTRILCLSALSPSITKGRLLCLCVCLQGSPTKQFRNTVAYLLKARTVEPEKHPLLANGPETTLVSRQQPRKKRDKLPLLGSHQRANELAE